MDIELSAPDEVGLALLAYLREQIQAPDLAFAEPLAEITHGWETYIYTFSLTGKDLDPAWARPLILRIYPGEDQAEKAEREGAVQRFAADRGYPAPRPLAVETESEALGRPFMVMERAPGITMLERIMADPFAVFRLAPLMADLHVALHSLPVAGWPLPSDGTLVDRRLDEMRTALDEIGIDLPPEAEKALAWLTAHKNTVVPEDRSVCHQDFHPFNIIVNEDDSATLIDWSGPAVGDRHSDIASTLVLVRTAPIQPPSLADRLLARFGRGILVWLYLRRYRQQLSIDPERLRYWEALRAAEWWGYGLALASTETAAMGVKPDTPDQIPADHAQRMERYFWQRAQPGERRTRATPARLTVLLVGGLAVLAWMSRVLRKK